MCHQGLLFKTISLLLAVMLGGCIEGGHDIIGDAEDIVQPRDSLRGERFCELIAVFSRQGPIEVDLYSSWTLNDCPADDWDALDFTEFRAEQNPLIIALRGPNFWTADESVELGDGYDELRFIDSIEFGYRLNHLLLPSVTVTSIYLNLFYYEFGLDLQNELVFFAGSRVYELISPVGKHYVMRSYSHRVDDTLSPDKLPEGLTPPPGWQFRQRVLEEDLRASGFQGKVTALWDNYYNTYYRAELEEIVAEDRVGVEIYNADDEQYWLAFMGLQEASALEVTPPWTVSLFQSAADKYFITKSPDQPEVGRFRQEEYFGHTFTQSHDRGVVWMIADASGVISRSLVYPSNELTYFAGSQISTITDPQGDSYILIRTASDVAFSVPELPDGWLFSQSTLHEDLRVLGSAGWIHAANNSQLYQGPAALPLP